MYETMYRLGDLPDLIARFGLKRPLLVASARWLPVLPGGYPVFSAFSANPDFDQCAAGACRFSRLHCDGLIAMGGGSAMDTAKTILAMLLSPSPADALAMQYAPSGIPLICIPTTAGSGSEATQTAVVYTDGSKVSLSHPALLPSAVILDSSVLSTLPYAQKRSCALDALCQAIESYWCLAATEESREVAAPVIPGILRAIRPYLEGDTAAAETLMLLSHRAGQAIQMTRTTAAHAMSYQLTKRLGIPHGDACALTLPFLWLRLTALPALAPRMEGLARLSGAGRAEDAALLFLGMRTALGLRAPGLPGKETLDALTASVNPERLSNHPEPLSAADILSVYTQALDPAGVPDTLYRQADTLWRSYAP